jgi:hypothetical protein
MALAATAQEVIQDAVLFAGIGDQYNALDGQTVALGLRWLNALTDSCSTEELTIFDIVEGTFNLGVVNNYLIGPTNNLGVRPVYVERVSIVDAQSVTHPLRIIGVHEWASITYLPAVGRPEVVYNDGNMPSSTWYFWPTPSFTGDVVHAWYWNVLPQFANLTDNVVAPPAFIWFLKTNLGLAMMGALNKEPTRNQEIVAAKAQKNARRLNKQPKVLGTDLPLRRGFGYNIYSDTP